VLTITLQLELEAMSQIINTEWRKSNVRAASEVSLVLKTLEALAQLLRDIPAHKTDKNKNSTGVVVTTNARNAQSKPPDRDATKLLRRVASGGVNWVQLDAQRTTAVDCINNRIHATFSTTLDMHWRSRDNRCLTVKPRTLDRVSQKSEATNSWP